MNIKLLRNSKFNFCHMNGNQIVVTNANIPLKFSLLFLKIMKYGYEKILNFEI